jgi:hypothetical protein
MISAMVRAGSDCCVAVATLNLLVELPICHGGPKQVVGKIAEVKAGPADDGSAGLGETVRADVLAEQLRGAASRERL